MTIKEKQHQLQAYADVLAYIQHRLSLLAQDVAMYSQQYETAKSDEERQYIKYLLDDLTPTINAYKSIISPIEYLATH